MEGFTLSRLARSNREHDFSRKSSLRTRFFLALTLVVRGLGLRFPTATALCLETYRHLISRWEIFHFKNKQDHYSLLAGRVALRNICESARIMIHSKAIKPYIFYR